MTKILLFAFFFLVSIFTLTLYFHNILDFQQDLGRHLLLGKIIWGTRLIPTTNLLSFSHPDFPFVNTHWLSEVVFYLVSPQFLLAVKTLIMTATVLLTTLTAYKFSFNLAATALAFVALSPPLLERTAIRPEIFSYLLTAIFVHLVYRQSLVIPAKTGIQNTGLYRFWPGGRNDTVLWILPFLQIVWVNLHIYFFLGPALVGLLALSKLWISLLETKNFRRSMIHNSKFIILFLATAGATLLNPHGLTGALYPQRVLENYGYSIVENQTIFFLEKVVFNPNIFFFKIAAVVIVLSFLTRQYKRAQRSWFSLLITPLLLLPFFAIRFLPLTFFLFLPVLADNLSLTRPELKSRLTKLFPGKPSILGLVILTLSLTLILVRTWRLATNSYSLAIDSDKRFGATVGERGQAAADFFLANNLPGPIFNNFDIGGYLAFRLYPQQQVFVDNRPEAFPQEFFRDIYIPMQQSKSNFDQIKTRFHFQTIFITHTDATPWGQTFLSWIGNDPNWSLVYLDDYAAIFIHKNLVGKLPIVNQENYQLPSSLDYLGYLSLTRVLTAFNWTDLAKQSLTKAYGLQPQSPLVNQALGVVSQREPGGKILAERYLRYYKEKTNWIIF